jgi:WD40 repeat protein
MKTNMSRLLAVLVVVLAVAMPTSLTLSQVNETSVVEVQWNMNGTKLAVAHVDGSVSVTRLSDGTQSVLVQPYAAPADIAWSPIDANILAIGVLTPPEGWTKVLIIDTDGGDTVLTIDAYPFINSLTWHPNGLLIAGAIAPVTIETFDTRNEIRIWNASTGEIVDEVLAPDATFINEISWSPTGASIAGATFLGAVVWNDSLFDESSRQQLTTLQANKVAWSPNGSQLAVYSFDDNRTLTIWTVENGSLELTYSTQINSLTDMDWVLLNGENFLAIADAESGVQIINSQSGQIIGLIPYTGILLSLDWSPSDAQFALGGIGNTSGSASGAVLVPIEELTLPPTPTPLPLTSTPSPEATPTPTARSWRITNPNASELAVTWQLVNSPTQMGSVTLPANGTVDFSTTVEAGNETMQLLVGGQVVAEATGSAEPCGAVGS